MREKFWIIKTYFFILENNFHFFSEMNSIRKRDYDADLERLKTFIDSYHNNDPETGKKGKILVTILTHIL